MRVRSLLVVLSVVGFAAGLAGCGNSSWEGARGKDTVAAYYRFVRDNPKSVYIAEANERIAFLRVSSAKTIESFEDFAATYPQSSMLSELRDLIEPLYFQRARDVNTAAAYRDFLRGYPSGNLTARALGNLSYVGTVRDAPTLSALETFAAEHPESDFLAEAQHSLDLLELRRQTQIRRLGVRVDVAPNVSQPNRVRRGFAAVVARNYRELGVEVQLIAPGEALGAGMDAWMRVDYDEPPAQGVFGGRTLLSRCRVRLYYGESEVPVWDHTFEASADHVLKGAYGRDKTVFGNSSYSFWEDFFVPLSTWATSNARAHRTDYLDEVAAIDVRGDRAALLYSRGGFDLLDVSSPLEPRVLTRYRREHDLSKWAGIEILTDDYIFTYGPDGVELIELSATKPRRLGRWELHEVGSIRSAEVYEKTTVLFAGSKGVYAIRLERRPLVPHRLLDGDFVGLEIRKPFVYLARSDRVEVSSPKHLIRHLTGSRVFLGKAFKAHRLRLVDRSLYVFGKDETVEVSLANPAHPKLVGKLDSEKFGVVSDMTWDDEHLYTVGSHGFQIAAPRGEWVADSVQVEADSALARKGRFVFLVGNRTLEVLDLGPAQTLAAASPMRQ